MSYKFTVVLSREITEEEIGALKDAGCPDSAISTAELPTKDKEPATQLDFDTEASATLAGAMEMVLDAVKTIPDLRPITLEVPAQPNGEPPESEDSLYELDPVPPTITAEVEDVAAATAEAEPESVPAATAEAESESESESVPAATAEAEPESVPAATADIETTPDAEPTSYPSPSTPDTQFVSSHTV